LYLNHVRSEWYKVLIYRNEFDEGNVIIEGDFLEVTKDNILIYKYTRVELVSGNIVESQAMIVGVFPPNTSVFEIQEKKP